MSLLGLLLRPVQSALSGPLRQVFEADVRHNPTIVNPIRQSDDDDAYQKEQRFGFAPQYVVSPRRPRTDLEAQRLYNHIRTVSWYLDAIPILGRSLPFNIGFEVSWTTSACLILCLEAHHPVFSQSSASFQAWATTLALSCRCMPSY